MYIYIYIQKKNRDAIKCYSKAIELEPENDTFLGNRSAAYLMLQKYDDSLNDCLKAIELNNKMFKCYSRAFQIYIILGDYDNADKIVTV